MASFAEVNGISLRYDYRAGKGPLIVLLHEMGGMLESWDLVWPQLHGHACLRLDLRGFGLSEKPRGPVTLEELSHDVRALLSSLGADMPVLAVGSAVGAAVSICLAATLGARCAGLIGLAPATGIPAERHAAVEGLARTLRRDGLREFIETDTAPKAWPPDLIPRGRGYALFRALQLSCDPEALAETYMMLTRIDLGSMLRQLSCPALMVAGRHDVARPPALVEALAASMPRGDFLEIDSGHFMALQSPDLVASLIRDFAAGLKI